MILITATGTEDYAEGVYKDLEVCRDCRRFKHDASLEDFNLLCLESAGPWKGVWEDEYEFEDGYAPKACRNLDRLRCIRTLREL